MILPILLLQHIATKRETVVAVEPMLKEQIESIPEIKG
jgi:hypothetical protein